MTHSNTGNPRFFFFLLLTAAICGGSVMVLEVLGSRVLGPFFGVSLFVWTSLIAVTLVALALGYFAGGVVSDKNNSPAVLYGFILAAGILILAIPYLKGIVLKSCMSFGLRAGSLAAAGLLFGPSIFLLGCVSPYVVKIAARETRTLGKTVGTFYAVSTIGSFLGTLLTGFVFLAHFRIHQIFYFIGVALILLSIGYFVFFRRKVSTLLLLLPALLLQPRSGIQEKVLANQTVVSEVYASDGFYGALKILDYSYGSNRVRELMIDGLIQGGIDMSSGLPVYQYPYLMQFLPYGMNPGGKSCLVLGLGAGVIPMWYEARGIRTDVVDVNPLMPEIARRYFGFSIRGDVFIADARYHLSESATKYDYIIVDVANGDWAPAHLITLESMRLLKTRMTENGIVAVNLIGSLRDRTLMSISAVRTMQQVFRSVKVYPGRMNAGAPDAHNMQLVASDQPHLAFDPSVVAQFPVHSMLGAGATEIVGTELLFPAGMPYVILTDEYNPGEFYDLQVKEQIRRQILSYTDWDMLL